MIIERCNLHVVGECHYQFHPKGATAMYLLTESHLSAHTFYETNKIIVDLFCCSVDFNPSDTHQIFEEIFQGVVSHFTILYRS
jgi:S-adenosylmethionine/arginine decarboxylase-like enzyme